MGLSIVHGIVTSYGGFITRVKNSDTGTVFLVYFPAIDQEIVPEIKLDQVDPKGNEKILIVDDEVMLAELGKAVLEKLGYEVTMCTSSLEALSLFQNQPNYFDAVVTDQTMPGITGMELAGRMLQLRPHLPIILCTGYSNLADEAQAKSLGIKGFSMKPVTKQNIATLLRKVLDNRVLV